MTISPESPAINRGGWTTELDHLDFDPVEFDDKLIELAMQYGIQPESSEEDFSSEAVQAELDKELSALDLSYSYEGSRSTYDDYLSKVRTHELLTADEERRLAQRIEKGDKAAFERMFMQNQRLVLFIAKNHRTKGYEIMDLVQEGNIGLKKAIEKFDWRRGYKFSTYAHWWITQGIRRTIAHHAIIGIPVAINDKLIAFRRLEAQNQAGKLGKTDEQMADELSFSLKELQFLRLTANMVDNLVWLNRPVSDDQDLELVDMMADGQPSVHEQVASSIENQKLNQALKSLANIERRVIEHRFGLNEDGKALDILGTAKILGIAREDVLEHERSAIKKFRQDPSVAAAFAKLVAGRIETKQQAVEPAKEKAKQIGSRAVVAAAGSKELPDLTFGQAMKLRAQGIYPHSVGRAPSSYWWFVQGWGPEGPPPEYCARPYPLRGSEEELGDDF